MAPPAAEKSRSRPSALALLAQPSRQRVEMALRLALICTLTTAVTEHYGTPEPALTAYLVFFLNKPERTSSLILNVAFVALITIVLAIVLLLAIFVVDEPAWRVAAMAAASMVLLFLTSASKLRPVGAILALIVVYALDVLGFVPTGELATRGLLYVWLFVAIPAGISLVTNLLIAPPPKRLAEKALATRLRSAAAMLRDPWADERAFATLRDAGTGEVLRLLHLARMEGTLRPEDAPRLQAAAASTGSILFVVDALRSEDDVPDAWRRTAATTLEEMAAAFEAGGYPVNITSRDSAGGPPADGLAVALTREFGDILASFANAAPERAHPPAGKAGFFVPDAFTNSDHVRYALKTTAAAMFCYFLYVLLDWPGIHTCLITCYIVALATTAETVEKLGLRILGCLAGAAAGIASIIWIVPALDSLGGLLAVVFAGTLCGAWISAGSARIAYAGFQFVFAFFLCVIQGAAPAYDLTIARDRVIGILIGDIVTYLMFTQIWPVTISHRIERAFASLLTEFETVLRLPLAARRHRAQGLQAQVASIGNDLALVAYEPSGVQPGPVWTAARVEALRALVALEGPALTDRQASFWDRCAERIGALGRQVAGTGTPPAPAGAEVAPAGASPRPTNRLQAIAVEQLRTLEKSLAVRS